MVMFLGGEFTNGTHVLFENYSIYAAYKRFFFFFFATKPKCFLQIFNLHDVLNLFHVVATFVQDDANISARNILGGSNKNHSDTLRILTSWNSGIKFCNKYECVPLVEILK